MADISALLRPSSVAIIGASPEKHKLRGLLLQVMQMHPYTGKIYPVSRSHDEVMGLKAYPAIGDVPAPVDLAVMVIPSRFVADELERCGEAGVRAVLIISSGFAEQSGDDGKAMQETLLEIANRFDMAVMGPNSEGFANTAISLAVTFSPAMNAPEKPLLPPWRDEGRIAVLAQSGAVGFSAEPASNGSSTPDNSRSWAGPQSAGMCHKRTFIISHTRASMIGWLLASEILASPKDEARRRPLHGRRRARWFVMSALHTGMPGSLKPYFTS